MFVVDLRCAIETSKSITGWQYKIVMGYKARNCQTATNFETRTNI